MARKHSDSESEPIASEIEERVSEQELAHNHSGSSKSSSSSTSPSSSALSSSSSTSDLNSSVCHLNSSSSKSNRSGSVMESPIEDRNSFDLRSPSIGQETSDDNDEDYYDIGEVHERLEDNLPQGQRELDTEPMSLQELATKWMQCQNGSRCSNSVADRFFKLAVEHCDDIQRIKLSKGGKLPTLTHLRKYITNRLTHGILMDFKFHDLTLPEEVREENAIHVIDAKKFPKKEFPSDKFELIYQPQTLMDIHERSCDHHGRPKMVVMSIDGVHETKSSNRSLEIVSVMFDSCREVYPCLIFRPESNKKKDMKAEIEAYISIFLDKLEVAKVKLIKVVLDAPERASLRKQKLYGGYFSCDICLANPENIRTKGKQSKRVFRPYMRFSRRRTHEETLAWGQQAQDDALEEVNGIFGKSVMFQVPGFNVIKDIFPEAMHLLDGGFMKNTCCRTFRQGKSAQTKDGYRRAPVEKLNKLLRDVKYVSDFARRAREYDVANFKCQEWRQMGLFLFPLLVQSLDQRYSHEKAVFLSFGFLNRAVRMPDDEFNHIPEEMFEDAVRILNDHYEEAFGATACSYNYHIVSSHLLELREFAHGPLTNFSAYPFEGMYAEMRKCFVEGTPNISKQIMQKILTKKYRHGDWCVTKVKPLRKKRTCKSRDDLFYIFDEGIYCLYQVLKELDGKYYECVEMNTEEKNFSRVGTLNFGVVGVFKNHGHTTIKKIIHSRDISGKVIAIKGLIMTIPKNVLQET